MARMIKILLMILLISTALKAKTNDCANDIKKLYPVAQKWVRFTTDFNKFYSTKIKITKKENPFEINYQILDFKKEVVFEDFITLPVEVKKRRNFKIPIIIGMGAFFVGILSGIIITIKIEKSN